MLDPAGAELYKAGRIQMVDGVSLSFRPYQSATQKKHSTLAPSPHVQRWKISFLRRNFMGSHPVVSGRGGAEKKTTIAASLRLSASWGMKVGLIDLDLTCGNLYSCFADGKMVYSPEVYGA